MVSRLGAVLHGVMPRLAVAPVRGLLSLNIVAPPVYCVSPLVCACPVRPCLLFCDPPASLLFGFPCFSLHGMDSPGLDCADRALELLVDGASEFAELELAYLLKSYEKSCVFAWVSPGRVAVVFSSRSLCLKAKETLGKLPFLTAKLYEGDPSLLPYIPAQRPACSVLTVDRIVTGSLGLRQRPAVIRRNREAHSRELEKIESENERKAEANERQMQYWNNIYPR